jgi:riboflavin synthase
MFAGIVEEIGVVEKIQRGEKSAQLSILAKTVLEGLEIGGSISVNGTCLTAVSKTGHGFVVEVSPETLRVTNLGLLGVGDGVNLERALRLGGRIDGHLVSGHVDGVGVIRQRRSEGNALVLFIDTPLALLRYCVTKGSIAVDGISLTINELTESGFSVTLIPHTVKMTTLGIKSVGATVNLENDLIGKYVERLFKRTESVQ